MLKSQKIGIEVKQVRSKLSDDSLESAERDKLVSEWGELESRHAAAIIAEGGDDGEEKPAPRDLVSRIDVGEYAAAAVEDRALTGPAKELAEELKLDNDRAVIPWVVLAADIEERSDAVSSGPTTGEQSSQHAALRRLFKGSLVDALGVSVRNVGPGKHAFPVLASGVAPAWYAKSAAVSSTAASITAKEISNVRLAGRYSWTREDAFEFSQLADLLRNDLRQAIVAKSNDTVVNGTGTAPEPSGIFKTLGNAPTKPSAIATLADFRDSISDTLGDYADNASEVRLFVARDAFKYLSGLGHSADGDPVGVEHIRSLADLRASGVLPNAPATGNRANVSEALTYGTRGAGTGIFAFFNGIELVPDRISGAAKAEVYLTAMTFANLVWRVTAPYERVSFKLA